MINYLNRLPHKTSDCSRGCLAEPLLLNGLRRRHRSHNAQAGPSEAKSPGKAHIVLGHFRKALQFPMKKLKDSFGKMGLPHHAP